MTVVTTPAQDVFKLVNEPCRLCTDPVSYPFIEWSSAGFCIHCCRTMRTGLVADLIHIVAIDDLHTAGYRGQTLVREGHQPALTRLAAKMRLTGLP